MIYGVMGMSMLGYSKTVLSDLRAHVEESTYETGRVVGVTVTVNASKQIYAGTGSLWVDAELHYDLGGGSESVPVSTYPLRGQESSQVHQSVLDQIARDIDAGLSDVFDVAPPNYSNTYAVAGEVFEAR